MRWATMLGCRGRCRDRNEQDCNCKRDLCHEHTSSLSPGGRLNAPTAEDPSDYSRIGFAMPPNRKAAD